MSDIRSTERGSVYGPSSPDRRGRYEPARRSGSSGPSTGLMIAGVAALALGAFAIYHFGPDFRRYIKMERM